MMLYIPNAQIKNNPKQNNARPQANWPANTTLFKTQKPMSMLPAMKISIFNVEIKIIANPLMNWPL